MLHTVKVRPITFEEISGFLRLPWSIYRGDSNWVPPIISEQKKLLDPKVNPFWQHAERQLFVAEQGGRILGRVAAIINHTHNSLYSERAGAFGFFECVDDQATASALLEAAAQWLRSRGMEVIRGPLSPSTNDECGLLIEGFDGPPVFMMPYNPPYYADLLEGWGLRKRVDLLAYLGKRDTVSPEWVERKRRAVQHMMQKLGIVVRPVDLKRYRREMRRFVEVYNRAWSGNWGFVPLTEAELDFMAASLKPLLVPDLLLMAERNGQTVGVSLTLPDYNVAIQRINGRLYPFGILKLLWYVKARRIKRIRFMALGVLPEYQKVGIGAALMLETYFRAYRMGYQEGEMSWILEDNPLMRNTPESVGLQAYRRYRIYERSL
jgi:GNAT superfamily N-acetyltransferase